MENGSPRRYPAESRSPVPHLNAANERQWNIALIFRIVTPEGTPGALLEIARQHRCTDVHFNLEYEINESRRNDQTRNLLEREGIAVHAYHDQVILPPADIRTGEGRFFSVFTPFRKAYYKLLLERGVEVIGEPKKQAAMLGGPDPIPTSVEGFRSEVDPRLWPAGEAAASRRLKAFIGNRISGYKESRDLPALDATSMLSAYLAAGVLSPRQCMVPALEANHGKFEGGNEGAACWISELVWREFYRHVLVGFPRVCMGRPFKPATDRIRWNTDAGALEAWRNGRTGVPIVDAAMRQLASMGWMHNRLRMIAAMYLTKDLFFDWREGERHFMRHLIDGDLASNNGGWQWSASTGTDAAPYFRIFNPISQSKKCDPGGEFIRRWVPELRGIEGDDIHDPSGLPPLRRSSLDYPEPIVDHSKARERVMKAFQALA